MILRYFILSWLHRKDNEDEIRNYALKLLRNNYGEITTTTKQLYKIYSRFNKHTIDSIALDCEIANVFGQNLIYNSETATGKKDNVFSDLNLKRHFYSEMNSKFPWIKKSNLDRIYNWSCYGKMLDNYEDA